MSATTPTLERRDTKNAEHGGAPSLRTGWEFLVGGGVTGELARSFDWSKTSLGSPQTWSSALKTVLGIMFRTRHPMFLFWGPDLIQFYNDAYMPSFGKGKHPAAMGQKGIECWPEIWDAIGPQIAGVMQHGVPTWHENQLLPIFRNGHLEDVYWTYGYSPVFEADGSVGGTLVVCQETTEAVATRQDIERAHESAQQASDEYRALAEAIPQQVWTSTPDGALDFVNDRVVEYFASTREDILGAGWQGVIHPEDLSTSVERWQTALATGDLYENEFRLRRGDGAYRWHLARALPMRDNDGEIIRWFGTNTDIDDQKKIREELAHRTEFEQHLVGIVSHDLRNPLSAILLGTHMLAGNESLDDRAAKVVSRIQSSAERGSRMIRDLLDFTQARLSGGIPVTPKPIDLHALAVGVIEEVRAAHPDRALELRQYGDGAGSWDADRIAQVIVNLVSNALQYGDVSAPVIVTSSGETEHVSIEVHNLGEPIPRDIAHVLFKPLKRGISDLDQTGRSIGLGLYIVKAIIDGHAGRIEVTSTRDAGTTFRVRLPRHAR